MTRAARGRTAALAAASLAGVFLALPFAAHAQIQLAPPPAPVAPAPVPPPSPLTPPAPGPESPPTGAPAEPPPLPLVFPPSGPGAPSATAPPPPNAPPSPGSTAPATLTQQPPAAPPAGAPAQPLAPAGPAPVPEPPNLWVPAHAAELDVLNKIDSRTNRLTIKAGQSATVGTITIAVKSCEVRPPNQAPDAAAWLTITDSDPKAASFQGWMLAREPAVSVLQSPVYDVHLTGCT